MHPAEGEYTHEEVASAIREAGGPTISATYLWQLRKGARANPTMKHREALSEFFGVPPAYFFDDEVSARIDAELSLLASLRDASVRQVALRASGLSPERIDAIVEMIERVRKLEGLSGPNGSQGSPGLPWLLPSRRSGRSRSTRLLRPGTVVSLAILVSPWWLLTAPLVVLAGWARVQIHDHTPVQVFAGAIVGAVVATGVSRGSDGSDVEHLDQPSEQLEADSGCATCCTR